MKLRRTLHNHRFIVLVLFGLLCFLLLGVYLFVWSKLPQDPLEVAYEKIEEGMGRREVMSIVGPDVPMGFTDPFDDSPRMFFSNNKFTLEIRLRDGRVTEKKLKLDRESLSDRLRRLVRSIL